MRLARFSFPTKFLASASCLVWISAISFSLIYLLQLPSLAGWIIAGFLTLVATIEIILFRFEMGHAIEINDYAEAKLLMETTQEESSHYPDEPSGDLSIF